MTTETQTPPQDPGIEVPGEKAPEGSPKAQWEEQARSMGWVSREEWVESGHNEEDHRSAKEFVERDSLYKRIKSYSNRVGHLERQLQEQADFQAKIFEVAKQQALQELEKRHAQAVEDGDTKQAQAIVREMTAKAASTPPPTPQVQSSVTEEYNEWRAANAWYGKDKVKTKFADQVGAEFSRNYIAQYGRRPTTTEVLDAVEAEVAETFKPERAQAPQPPAGGTTRRTGGKGKGLTRADLSDVELQVMNTLIKSGDITEEVYLKNAYELQQRGKR